jgi:hypothetical protein
MSGGHHQFAKIVKAQDPEVDIRIMPEYGTSPGASHYTLIDRHTSVRNLRTLDPHLVNWMETEMN